MGFYWSGHVELASLSVSPYREAECSHSHSQARDRRNLEWGEQWIAHDSWELVSEASEACGRSVEDLLLRADADELRQTRNSQLATFVLSMVTLDAVERTGLAPNYAAGHSLGEYSALCASGVLSYEDAGATSGRARRGYANRSR